MMRATVLVLLASAMLVDGRLRVGSLRTRVSPHKAPPALAQNLEDRNTTKTAGAKSHVHTPEDERLLLLGRASSAHRGDPEPEMDDSDFFGGTAAAEGQRDFSYSKYKPIGAPLEPRNHQAHQAANDVYNSFFHPEMNTVKLPCPDTTNGPLPMPPGANPMQWTLTDPCGVSKDQWDTAQALATSAVSGAVEGAMNFAKNTPHGQYPPLQTANFGPEAALEWRLKHAAKAEYDALWGPLPPWAIYAAMQSRHQAAMMNGHASPFAGGMMGGMGMGMMMR